jgi:two-component system sensor histidine kinase HydH|tara:strand:- start:2559 stop:3953 length:1395 start_codon:yes stop_codon:yes gene_type:complete
MTRPFPLLSIFSLASLFAVAALMAVMSWLLGQQLENELLKRDKVITVATVQAEVLEYLQGSPFEQTYLDPLVLRDILHAVMVMPGSYAIEIILPSGKVAWSSFPGETTTTKDNPQFKKAMLGEATIRMEDEDRLIHPNADERYISALYIPIRRGENVEGVLELHRNNVQLRRQVDSLQRFVWVFCGLFGLLLYTMLLLIVYPASRILSRQHEQLRTSAFELERINQQLRNAQTQLLKQERLSAIGEVSATVAHGLKNPLASLRAALQLLTLQKLDPEEHDDLINDMLHETDRLTTRLNHLLNFVRPFDQHFQKVALLEILQKAVHSLHWQIDELNLKLKIPTEKELPTIEADPVLLEEVLLIVLSNAIQASSSGGTIECYLESVSGNEDSQIQTIAVKDYGEGIVEENLDRIFEQFFTTRSRGSGLGLSICKKIVDLHHGSIEIKSEIDKGTTVRLCFPVQHTE